MSVNTIIASVYAAVALTAIFWFINRNGVEAHDRHWGRFRRHGFTRLDLDVSVLFGMLILIFNALIHAAEIAKYSTTPWMDFAGTTLILATAIVYVVWRKSSISPPHAMRRGVVFFAPMLGAMAIDQYLAKAAKFIAQVEF